MAYPTSPRSPAPSESAQVQPTVANTLPQGSPAPARAPKPQAAPTGAARCGAGYPRVLISEADHQREKLEFALAVAVSRGDRERIESLQGQIAALGAFGLEPGT